MDVFDLVATIRLDTSEYDRGLDQARENAESFSDKLTNAGKAISSAGSTLTKSVTLPIAGLGTAIIKTGMDYEAGMSKVQAISGATGAEMDRLGEKAMEMAAKTKFSTADSAEAYQYMAMAGWKANDMIDGLAGIMNLAAASGENLGTTSDIVTDALTAFGLKASDSGRFADVLAAASNNANTNVSMLGESFKYVAPVAGAMGYSVEDISVALGLMANSGIKATQAGTSLRTAITNMAKPTSNMVKVMDEYGISLTDTDGKMLSFSEIMKVLRDKMGGLDEATQASAAATLFGKEAMSGMLAIINAAPEDFDKLTNAINNSAGTTEKMANIMQDNAAGAFERLKSAVNVLFTQLSTYLIPSFTSIVEKATAVVNWFGQLDDSTQRLILTIAGISAVVGPVLIVVGKIVTAVGQIGGAISGVLTATTSGISTIIGLGGKLTGGIKALFALIAAHPVIAVITAIIAAVVLLWNKCEWFRDSVKALLKIVVEAFKSAWENIKKAWEGAKEFFANLIDGIKSAFEGVGEFIGGIFKSAWELVKSAWSAAKEFFAGVWENIKAVFAGVAEFFGNIFRAAADAIKAIWDGVVTFFTGVWESIKNVFSVVAEVLSGFFKAAWEAVKAVWSTAAEFFSGVWESIKNVFSAAAEVIGGAFRAAFEAAKAAWSTAVEFFTGVWNSIKSVFSTVAETLGGFFQAAWDVVRGVWEAAVEFFSAIASGILAVFETVTQAIANAFTTAWEAVKAAWDAAGAFFSQLWNDISSAVKQAGEAIKDALVGAWDAVKSAWNGVTSFFSGIVSQIIGVFTGIGSKFLDIGRNIVNGIKNGISGAWSSFTKWLDDKVGGIVKGVKKTLGIKSPSRVFAGIGENMALGLAVGWEDQYNSIKRKIEDGMNFGTATVGVKSYVQTNGGLFDGSNSWQQQPVSRGGDTYNFYSPTALDPVSAAREMKKAKQQMALGYVGG